MMEVKIPEVGESIVEVQIGQWLKAEGAEVTKDEPLAVIESEKTTFELPTPESGILSRILCQAGETVQVGAIIAHIEPRSAELSSQPAAPQVAVPPSAKAAPLPQPRPERSRPSPAPQPARLPTPRREQPPAKPTPAAFAPVQPKDGVVEPPISAPALSATSVRPVAPSSTARSVAAGASVAALTPAASPDRLAREEEIVPMSVLRRTVARRLLEAQRSTAMVTTFNEGDMGAVQILRQQRQEAFQRRYSIRLGFMSFFVKAAIAGLKEFPQLNAEVRGDNIVYRNYFDIGVAIATPQGLVVPVLTNAERLSFAEIEIAIADFARRAKERQLKPEDLEGGTFTITNGGVFGSLLSTPLINPPQSGILGLHAITDRPVARGSQVVIRPMMYVALTYNHCLVDGREAVLFLRRIKELVEDPARMLIEA